MDESNDKNNASNHPGELQHSATTSGIHHKKENVIDIISHRRMILERIKLCRKASENRLRLYKDVEASDVNGPLSDQRAHIGTDNFVLIPRHQKYTSRQEEMQSYRDLCDHAMKFTIKKEPVTKLTVAPAPRAISLRTGSGVGNKMKAAVATLTSNTGWVSDSSSHSVVNPNLAVTASDGKGPLPFEVSSKPIHAIQNVQSSAINNLQQNISPPDVPMSSGVLVAGVPSMNNKNFGKQMKKKSSISTKKKIVKVATGSSTSLEISSNVTLPLHQGIKWEKGSTLNGKDHDSIQKANPEAERLRKRRKNIILKLDSLVQSNYDKARSQFQNDGMMNKSTVHRSQMTTDDNPYCSNTNLTWTSIMDIDKTPLILPPRQKSQWDFVMEEMRWLATDFLEERKWKVASLKAISSALKKYVTATERKQLTKIKNTVPTQKTTPIYSEKDNTLIVNDEVMVKVESGDENDEESDSESENRRPAAHLRKSNIEYIDPSDEDIAISRIISSEINSLVELEWTRVINTAEKEKLDEMNHLTLERYKESNPNLTKWHDIDDASEFDSLTREKKQLRFAEIESAIESLSAASQRMKEELTVGLEQFQSDLDKRTLDISLKLHPHQAKSLQFLDCVLNDCNSFSFSGSVISGPFGCGKTVTAATLLWLQRAKGPQILICPAASMIRWRHELGRFNGIDLLFFDRIRLNQEEKRCGNFNLQQNSIILCDISGLDCIISRLAFTNFSTIVVDSRCSSFLSMQYAEFDEIEYSEVTSRRYESQPADHRYAKIQAKEIMDQSWWNNLSAKLIRSDTKCLLIEFNGVVEGHAWPCLIESKPGILSSKAAFIYHRIFYSNKSTFGRRAFWWAKKQAALCAQDECSKQLMLEVSRSLQKIIDQVSCLLLTNEDEDNSSSSIAKWSVQLCEFSESQRNAYVTTCAFIRGSLLSDATSCSKALLRLRQTCFHSNLHDLKSLRGSIKHPFSRIVDASRWKINGQLNASQPDSALAKDLMENSSKLHNLLEILIKECGFDVPDKNFLLESNTAKVSKKKIASKRKRVLILGGLPEVLLLISSFLNAIGIPHDLLPPHNGIDPYFVNSSLSGVCCNDFWWNRSQQILSQFESVKGSAKDDVESLGVLVSSPHTLASTSLGLCAANADVIISMDEDWSGQSDICAYSILRKSIMKRTDTSGGRKYIKLVSKSCCEQNFLTYNKKGRGKKTMMAMPYSLSTITQWKMDPSGHFLSSSFSPMGQNVLRFSNMPIDTVFCTDAVVQCHTLNRKSLLFLPMCCSASKSRNEKFDSDLPDGDKNAIAALSFLDMEHNKMVKPCCIEFGRALSRIERVSSHVSVQQAVKSFERSFTSSLNIYMVENYRAVANGPVYPSTKQTENPMQLYVAPSDVPRDVTHDDDKSVDSVESLTHVISTSSAEDIASSLIWYKRTFSKYVETCTRDLDFPKKKRRINYYVHSYKNMEKCYDGNLGEECLLYHPPIFPGIQKFKESEHEHVTKLYGSMYGEELVSSYGDREIAKNSKKMRKSDDHRLLLPSSHEYHEPNELDNLKEVDLNFITGHEHDTDFMATDFFDGDGLFPEIIIDKPDEILGVTEHTIGSSTNEIENISKSGDTYMNSKLGEDFGLLGPGVLPSLQDSRISSIFSSKIGNSYSFWSDDVYVKNMHSDFEIDAQNGMSLSSMILSVKKSSNLNRTLSNGLQRLKSSFLDMDAYLASNGIPVKDLMKSVPKEDSFSLIDTAYLGGTPSVNLHSRIQGMITLSALDRFNITTAISESTYIRELLPNENTGDAAKAASLAQLQAYDNHTEYSCDSDFGPFCALSLPSRVLSDTSDLRGSNVGIKLPMGVKVPKLKVMTTIHDWDDHQNAKLKEYAEKYKFNWHAVSQAMSHINSNHLCVDTSVQLHPVRSARECRERWMGMHETTHELLPQPVTPTELDTSTNLHIESLLINFSLFANLDNTYNHGNDKETFSQFKSRSERIKKGNAMKVTHTLQIPRYNGDPTGPVQVMASHHSHAQSVQNAIALAAQSSGVVPPRAEMWPLQFLDLCEKQQAHSEKMKNSKLPGHQAQQVQTAISRSQYHAQHQQVPRSGPPVTASSQLKQNTPPHKPTQVKGSG